MGLFLKQSTAVDVIVGPFIDDGDGKTAETGLTVTQAEVRLSKNGGNMAQKNEATALAHDELGYYDCNLNATDTNTLGRLQLMVHESGALPVYHEYMVVTANVYDSLCSTDILQADLTQMGGVAQSATDLKDFADAGYNPATNKVTGVVLVDTTTTNTDLVTAAATADAVWDEAVAGHVGAGTFGKTDADILADTNELQGDWENTGRLDTIVDAIKSATDNLPVDPADDSDLDTQLTTITTHLTEIKGAGFATGTDSLIKIHDDHVTHLSAAPSTHAAADVWTEAMEGAVTAKEQMNINHAVLAGKSSGGGTATIKFRDQADGKDRVDATVDANGNRTAITNDGA